MVLGQPVAGEAELFGVLRSLQSDGNRLGNAAALTDGNQIMHQLLVEDLVSAPDLTPVEGRIGLFEAPGLGIELDRDAVARAAERYCTGGPS